MGSFPSTLEEPATPLSAGGESSRTVGSQAPPLVHPRARTLIIKKLTRGKVLLVGLDGAGKSTFARQLIRLTSGGGYSNTGSSLAATTGNNDSESTAYYPDPTTHQVTWSYRVEGDRYLQLVDLPGRRESRGKWYTGPSGDVTSASNNASSSGSPSHTGVGAVGGGGGHHHHTLPLVAVVFVVDASDRVRFPVVAAELARFQQLRERSSALSKAPFFLLLNKTDRYLPLQLKQQQQQHHHGEGGSKSTATTSQQQFHQAQLREVRSELRKCVDYELKMLQRRRPDSGKSEIVASSKPAAPRVLSPYQFASSPVSARDSMVALGAGSARAPAPPCTVMNLVMECCSQDPESVGAVHAWIKDEVKKVLF